MEYKLTKKELKNGKYEYTVLDGEGNVVSRRTSGREYVAATIMGDYYFGRRDLIGKGEHGRMLNKVNKTQAELKANPEAAYAEYIKTCKRISRKCNPGTYDEFIAGETSYCECWLHRLKVAYLTPA